MTILTNPHYHGTINTYTAVFGTIFNNIKIKRKNGKLIKVPISYASAQKYNVRNEQNDKPNAIRYKRKLPRLSFELIGWQRDPVRNKNPLNRLTNAHAVDLTTSEGVKVQYNRVPYTFSYRLDMAAEYVDDILQVFEQIAVYFNPGVEVVVKDNPDLEQETSIMVKLLDSDKQDIFEGLIEDDRELEITFNFEVDGYLYMPTSDSGIIKRITLNYYDLNDPETILETDIVE